MPFSHLFFNLLSGVLPSSGPARSSLPAEFSAPGQDRHCFYSIRSIRRYSKGASKYRLSPDDDKAVCQLCEKPVLISPGTKHHMFTTENSRQHRPRRRRAWKIVSARTPSAEIVAFINSGVSARPAFSDAFRMRCARRLAQGGRPPSVDRSSRSRRPPGRASTGARR